MLGLEFVIWFIIDDSKPASEVLPIILKANENDMPLTIE